MSRLIDAAALKCKIVEAGQRNKRYKVGEIWELNCSEIFQVIDSMATIEERKSGRWARLHGFCTPGGDSVWACSECGKGIHVYGIEHGTYGSDISDGQWKACPNCGAVMTGEA